jgi:hypothetical protein
MYFWATELPNEGIVGLYTSFLAESHHTGILALKLSYAGLNPKSLKAT